MMVAPSGDTDIRSMHFSAPREDFGDSKVQRGSPVSPSRATPSLAYATATVSHIFPFLLGDALTATQVVTTSAGSFQARLRQEHYPSTT